MGSRQPTFVLTDLNSYIKQYLKTKYGQYSKTRINDKYGQTPDHKIRLKTSRLETSRLETSRLVSRDVCPDKSFWVHKVNVAKHLEASQLAALAFTAAEL